MSINALEVSRMLVADKKNNVPVTRSKDIIHGNKWLDEALENMNNYVTPEMFGAVGDGVTDDTEALQASIENANGKAVILTKIYLTDDIDLHDTAIIGIGNATLVKKPRNQKEYKVVNLTHNAILKDITIIGDRKDNTTDGEWGHCAVISGDNCIIDGITAIEAHGDGVYIGGNVKADNAIVKNCMIDHAYRNGISVTNAQNFTIDNCIIKNVEGTDPQYAIDIEPNEAGEYATGLINNVIMDNCLGGVSIFINSKITVPLDIKITNTTVIGIRGRYAFYLHETVYTNSNIYAEGFSVINSTALSSTNIVLNMYGNDNSKVYFKGAVSNSKSGSGILIRDVSGSSAHTNSIDVDVDFSNCTSDNIYIVKNGTANWKGKIKGNATIKSNLSGFVYSPENYLFKKSITVLSNQSETVTFSGRSAADISIVGASLSSLGMYKYVGYGEGERQKIASIASASNVDVTADADTQSITITNRTGNYISVTLLLSMGQLI